MPWSPIGKFEDVIKRVKGQGYEHEAPITELQRAMMLETGIINERTLIKYIKAMEKLGMIKIKNTRVVEIVSETLE
mgnify:CR=1 FL=1